MAKIKTVCSACGDDTLNEIPVKTWDVEDYGIAGVDNAVWIYCEHNRARDLMSVGTTCQFRFKSGVCSGRDSVAVKRLT